MVNKNLMIILAVIAAIALIAIISVLAINGMAPRVESTPTMDANVVLTSAAQTADYQLTQIAQITPSATPEPPTPTTDPTQTAVVQTADALLTQAALITLTPAGTATATIAPTVSTADRAEYVLDVTIPDGTDFEPKAAFTKTWRLKNSGTSTWTTSYALVFISGEKMGDTTSIPLTENVAPGDTVDISVDLVAPTSPGNYKGYWKMLNAAGQFFEDSIYVDIDVVTDGGATVEPSATPAGGSGGDLVSDLSMVVDETSYSGTCPHIFSFSATFTLKEAATLTYGLEAGSDTPGFQFNLPSAQTASFSAGTFTLSFPLEFSTSVSGWIRLHITAPDDVTSNQVSFTLTCQ